jgi:hypothetical protein
MSIKQLNSNPRVLSGAEDYPEWAAKAKATLKPFSNKVKIAGTNYKISKWGACLGNFFT